MKKDEDRSDEFRRQAASIAVNYAEWHKEGHCRSAIEKALAEAYEQGRLAAATKVPA
jgi:hypothetical protein